MFSGSLAGNCSRSALGIIRNDVSQPTSLGFMKPLTDEIVAKQSETSTLIADNLKILETIPLPDSFDLEEVRKVLENKIKIDIEKDPLRSIASNLSKYANNFYEKMESYFEGIFDFDNQLRERKRSDVFSVSKEYLMSDLPASYVEVLSSSLLTEIKFLDLFDYTVRRERLKLRVVRHNNKKFKRICDGHNSWIDKLNPFHNSMVDSRIRLLWYVDFHNCKTAEEAFEFKVLKKSLIDKETFFSNILELHGRTDQFRKALIELNKHVFHVSSSRDDSTVNLLCNSVELMNSLG